MKKRLAHLLRTWAHRLDPQSPFEVIHHTITGSTGSSYTLTLKPKGKS